MLAQPASGLPANSQLTEQRIGMAGKRRNYPLLPPPLGDLLEALLVVLKIILILQVNGPGSIFIP